MQFTIVTPVLNGMPWLAETMDSVARQTPDVEVEHIVFDSGSTDGSREWLRDHAGKHVKLKFEPDQGQTDALIKGFAAASGDIFGWLNADDILEPGALRRLAAEFEARPDAALVSGSALLIGPTGAIVGAIPTPPARISRTCWPIRSTWPCPRRSSKPLRIGAREVWIEGWSWPWMSTSG